MTVSLPDDLGAYLTAQPNASAVVAAAVRQVKRFDDAQAYAENLRNLSPDERTAMDALDRASNELSLRGHEW